MTKVYNRNTKQIEEVNHYGGNALNFIYKHPLITRIITNRFLSVIYGWYNKTRLSKIKIKKFIKDTNIDMSLYKETKYKCFNDFFIRELKNINVDKKGFISPCDSKLLVYKFEKNKEVMIKGFSYKIEDLVEDSFDLDNAYVFVFRLSVDNYHRFHYIDDGKLIKRKRIHGRFHTVSDSSSKYKIYKENEREYSILDTKNFGKIIYIEVGALMIGKIINHDLDTFKRGQEKGYFLPGGSTVIIIANNIKVDKDILENSANDIETLIRVGEKIGD